MTIKRGLLLSLLLAGLLGSVSLWVTHSNAQPQVQAEKPEAAAPPDIVAAAPGWVDVQGGTRHLSAKVDGTVTVVSDIDAGVVDGGSVLLRVDDHATRLAQQANALDIKRLEITRKNLAAELAESRANQSRLAPLVHMQAEPASELRQAQAQARGLDARLHIAQVNLQASRVQQEQLEIQRAAHVILAPVRGRVIRSNVHPGEAVSRGAEVIWFAPDAPLIVRAELDERLFSKVKVGMRAEVESESGDGHVTSARLLRIAQAVGPVRALPEVKASAKDDRVVECILTLGKSDLLIGQRVTVRILAVP